MSAIISDCGRYRYNLTRPGDFAAWSNPAVFILLNPSTADAEQDDPTIRRCRNFALRWGCDGIVVVNLYAWRATDPKELWLQQDPVGPENDVHIARVLEAAEIVVCAWGVNAKAERTETFCALARAAGVKLHCLGTTKYGHPRHPLYVRGDQWPVEYFAPTENNP